LFFSLAGNELDGEAGKAIGKALETNKTVQTIEYARICPVSDPL